MLKLTTLLVLILSSVSAGATASTLAQGVRLYVLDCGELEFGDLAPFADTGEYEGHPGTMKATCVLVRHPNGDLLWDAGLGDDFAASPEGVKLPTYRATVKKTLSSQLAEIGLAFADVEYFAFSHGHADHLGNAGKLGAARWIVNTRELAWLQSVPVPARTNPKLLSAFNPATAISISGDHDVFGDGRVRVLSAVGHTPGHQVLLVDLKKQGAVVVSGDLFHTKENREGRRMPIFNVNRADTLASIDRIEAIIKNKRARLLIQHSTEDFDSVPHAPLYLE